MSRKKKLGESLGSDVADFRAQIALDADQGGQQGHAKAERNQEGRRQCAGPVQIGDGEPQRQMTRMRRPARESHDRPRDAIEQSEADDDGRAELRGEARGRR